MNYHWPLPVHKCQRRKGWEQQGCTVEQPLTVTEAETLAGLHTQGFRGLARPRYSLDELQELNGRVMPQPPSYS